MATEAETGDGRAPDHIEPLRVRFSDTDAGGIVHHSNFFRWLEEARLGLLRGIGVSYWTIADSGIHFPVTACSAEFRRSLRSEDQIEIALWLVGRSRARLEFRYEVRLDGSVVATAKTTHALVNDSGRPIRLERDSNLWNRLGELEGD
jgi:acyl-CoA thioester hydrolase